MASQRKQRRDAAASQTLLAVAAHFWQKDVAKRAHHPGAIVVAARVGNFNDLQRQPHAARLPLQQFGPDAVHGYAVESLVDGTKQARHLNAKVLPQGMRAVFAGTP